MASVPEVRQPLVAGTNVANRPTWHIATTADTAACAPDPASTRTLNLYPEYVDAAGVYDLHRCHRPGCWRWWRNVPGRQRAPLTTERRRPS